MYEKYFMYIVRACFTGMSIAKFSLLTVWSIYSWCLFEILYEKAFAYLCKILKMDMVEEYFMLVRFL